MFIPFGGAKDEAVSLASHPRGSSIRRLPQMSKCVWSVAIQEWPRTKAFPSGNWNLKDCLFNTGRAILEGVS